MGSQTGLTATFSNLNIGAELLEIRRASGAHLGSRLLERR
jgi:hypothetical protein